MDFCSSYHRVAWTRKTPGTVLLTRLRCKQWSCPYCAKANQRIWRAFLAGQLPIVSDNWWHVTLTAHSRMRSQDASYKNLQRGIDALLKRMRRVFGKIQYVRVFEPHPSSGTLHAHLAVSDLAPFVVPGCHKNLQHGFLPVLTCQAGDGSWSIRTWLKKAAQECHIGYQADVRQAQGENTVWYITKYLTKVHQTIAVKGLRHVSTSHRVGSPGNEAGGKWEVGSFITPLDIERTETVIDLQTGERLARQDIEVSGVYPPPEERQRLTNGL